MVIDLSNQLDKLKSQIPREDWKYFHLENFENYVFHLKNISGDRTRERISRELGEYLDIVEQELSADNSHAESFKSFYAKKLFHISMMYENELKFIPKPYYPITVGVFIINFLILFWTMPTIIAIVVWLISVIGYALYVKAKLKSRKYY